MIRGDKFDLELEQRMECANFNVKCHRACLAFRVSASARERLAALVRYRSPPLVALQHHPLLTEART